MLNFNRFKVLTFDCYGTLINWEEGIIQAIRPVLQAHNIRLTDNEILDLYAQLESEAESGEFKSYKTILRSVVSGIGEEAGFEPARAELDSLVESVGRWQPFPDTVNALQKLKKKYKLAILSNIDDDLIALSLKRLKVKFDWVITAQQVKSYKPSLNNFHQMIKRIGQPKANLLHVAQSVFHDIVPAKKAGLSTVWINRSKLTEGFGATPPAYAEPDLELADLQSLATLALGKK